MRGSTALRGDYSCTVQYPEDQQDRERTLYKPRWSRRLTECVCQSVSQVHADEDVPRSDFFNILVHMKLYQYQYSSITSRSQDPYM